MTYSKLNLEKSRATQNQVRNFLIDNIQVNNQMILTMNFIYIIKIFLI